MVRVGPSLGGEERVLAERLGVLDSVVELGMIPDAELPALQASGFPCICLANGTERVAADRPDARSAVPA